jgi:tetratricopeptide (TPR) repeat protein
MPGRGLESILNAVGELAQQEGVPTYAQLQAQLAEASAKGDAQTEASVGHQIGTWLYAIGSVANMRREFPLDPVDVLERAADHFTRAIDAARRFGDRTQQRLSGYQRGRTLYELQRYDEAEETLKKAIDIQVDERSPAVEYMIARDLGDCALVKGEVTEALDRYRRALQLSGELGDPYEEATQLGKVAAALEKMNRFEEAIATYEKAVELYRKISSDSSLQDRITVQKNLVGAATVEPAIAYAERRIESAGKMWATQQSVAVLPLRQAAGYRHADHYLRELASLGDRFRERTTSAAAAHDFDQELGQIQRGQAWSASNAAALPLSATLCIDYAVTGGTLRDARMSADDREGWFVPALTSARALNESAMEATLLLNSSWNCADLGRTEEAQTRIMKALELSTAAGDRRKMGLALISLSHLHNLRGRYQEALEALTEGQSLVADSDGVPDDGQYLANLVVIYQSTGDYSKALEYSTRDVEIARERGDRHRESRALGNLGLTYHNLGRYQDALKYHQQALDISRAIGDKRSEAAAFGNAGIAWMELHRFGEAEDSFQRALVLARELDDRSGEEGALGNLGHVFQLTGRHHEAIESLSSALKIAQSRGHRTGETSAYQALSKTYLDLKDYVGAVECAEKSRTIAREIGQPFSEAGALMTLGRVAMMQQHYGDALSPLQEALEIARATHQTANEAGILQHLALVFEGLGRREEALLSGGEALRLLMELGLDSDAQATDLLLQRIHPDGDAAGATARPNVYSLLFEWMNIPVVDVKDSEDFLRKHEQILLKEETENILRYMLGREPDNGDLYRHHKLLQKSRADGIEATYRDYGLHVLARAVDAFDEWRQSPEGEQGIDAIVEWVTLPDREASRKYVEENRDRFLTLNIGMALNLLVDKVPDAERFKQFRELFNACRKVGIDKAYDTFDTVYWHLDCLALVINWFGSPTEEYLKLHEAKLLTDETEQVLQLMMKSSPNRVYTLFLDVVRQARAVGICESMKTFHERLQAARPDA